MKPIIYTLMFLFLMNCIDTKLVEADGSNTKSPAYVMYILNWPVSKFFPQSNPGTGPEIVVAQPVFSVIPGFYSSSQTVSITTSTPGATIYYTTDDGKEPSASTSVYTAPIMLNAKVILKAIGIKSGLTDSNVTSGEYSFPYLLLKTGQTTSYATGDDVNLQKGTARSYADNSDGTIKDNVTGLTWQKCTRGLSGTTCATGSATASDWTTAGSYCSSLSLASKTWRLPTIQELGDLVDYSRATSPVVNVTFFPNTLYDWYYWSSTTNAANTNQAWFYYFQYNNASNVATSYWNKNETTFNFYVRCVSTP